MINSDSMKLLNYFEKHLDELLKILEGAVNLESPSHENKNSFRQMQ